MLEEHTTLLGLQDMDREVREAIQAVELEHGLYPPDGHDLSVELDKAHASVNRMVYDRNTEAEQLSRQVVQVANILVDLGLLPIEDIPQLLNTTQWVLLAVAHILKSFQEALDSITGPWNWASSFFFTSPFETDVKNMY
jgi:hypothetical protein